jgi:hypothetical protein
MMRLNRFIVICPHPLRRRAQNRRRIAGAFLNPSTQQKVE